MTEFYIQLTPTVKKIIIGCLFVLLAYLSLVPRALQIATGDFIFGFDQGRDYLAARSIVVDHKQRLIGSELGGGFAGLGGIYQGPLYYYLLTIPFIMFGGHPYGGIVLMFGLSLASIVFAVFFGYKLFGLRGAFLYSLLLAVSPTFIQQTKYIWNTHPSTIFILLTFYAVYMFSIKPGLRLLFISAFLSGIIYNFQTAVAIPMCLGLLVWLAIRKESRWQYYFTAIVAYILAFSPLLLFWIKHKTFTLSQLWTGIVSGGKLKSGSTSWYSFQLDHMNTFVYGFLDTFPRPHILFSLVFGIILFILVIIFLRKEDNSALKSFYTYLLLLIPTSFFVFSFLHNSIYVYYLMQLNIVYILMFVYLLVRLGGIKYVILKYIFYGAFAVYILSGSYFGTREFVRNLSAQPSMESFVYKVKAVDRVYSLAQGKPFGLFVFTPPVYIYEYDYILEWHGRQKYGYIPSLQKKEEPYYMLIQPDSTKPWSYNGWIETVVKPGSDVTYEKLESGLLIGRIN